VVQASQGFRLHLVAPEQAELVWRFGTTSGHDVDKFAEANWPDSQWGRPELVGAVGWLECGIESQVETGDRVFFLARVLAGERCRDLAPLTLHGFIDRLTPVQRQELKAQLTRDEAVDADLIRRWSDAGHLPLAIRPREGE
jgi:flavin reductase (DIM6/NTAB) family NADH-FMN oxidoreductase RutF